MTQPQPPSPPAPQIMIIYCLVSVAADLQPCLLSSMAQPMVRLRQAAADGNLKSIYLAKAANTSSGAAGGGSGGVACWGCLVGL